MCVQIGKRKKSVTLKSQKKNLVSSTLKKQTYANFYKGTTF